MKLRLPSKDSAIVRSLRVVVYVAAALGVAYFAKGEDLEFILRYFPEVTALITALPPVITLVVNIYRKTVPNY
jgi:hypothetical protein